MAYEEHRSGTPAVLFDLDGVLADSRVAISRSINYALKVHGLGERAEASLHRFIGPPLGLSFAELTRESPDSALVLSCVNRYRERYADASLLRSES